jgi:hypothetical protein
MADAEGVAGVDAEVCSIERSSDVRLIAYGSGGSGTGGLASTVRVLETGGLGADASWGGANGRPAADRLRGF